MSLYMSFHAGSNETPITCSDPIKDNCTCFTSSSNDDPVCGCRHGYEAVMVSGSPVCQGEIVSY